MQPNSQIIEKQAPRAKAVGDSAGSAASSAAPPAKKGPPPEWPAERFVKAVGRLPGAAGRVLDRAAKVPFLGAVVRRFSSVVFGLVILGLIGVYIAIGSGMADLRAKMEMTDLQFFDAWPMRVLLVLLVLDLGTVTLRRIPLTLFKLGSWTVHVGIFTMITGCVIYFSGKEEGSARIYLHQTIDSVYDTTERAMYAFRIDANGQADVQHAVMLPMTAMPYFFDRVPENGNGMDKPIDASPLAALDPRLKNLNIRVTGYYAAASMAEMGIREARPGEQGEGPALEFAVESQAAGPLGEARLYGNSPVRRAMDGVYSGVEFGIQYMYHPDANVLKDMKTSFKGPVGITVRIKSTHFEHTYAVEKDQPIVIEGTPYTLTPRSMGENQMASEGYKGATTTVLGIDVARKEADGKVTEFQRQALARYPERSPDFITEDGKPKRIQDRFDKDLEIIFLDATAPQFWIVEDASGKLTLVGRTQAGVSTTQEISADGTVPLEVSGLHAMRLHLEQHLKDAVAVLGPVPRPLEQRTGGSAQEAILSSVAQIEISGVKGSKSQRLYLPFVQFAEVKHWNDEQDPGVDPVVVDVPEVGRIGFIMSTERRPLPAKVTLAAFEAKKYPGAERAYVDYRSTLVFTEAQNTRTETIHLNEPARDRGLTYFQAAWSGGEEKSPDRVFSVVGIGNRPGVWGMIAGAALIVLGIGYAFYAKPVLLRMKKEQALAWAKT